MRRRHRRKAEYHRRTSTPVRLAACLMFCSMAMSVSLPAGSGVNFSPVTTPAVGWEYYEWFAVLSSKKHGVPTDMFMRLLRVENPWGDPLAVNPKSGAAGLGQFMPGTALLMGIDPYNPHDSIDASARYLSHLYDMFDDWHHAVMAYNWGPGNVQKCLADIDCVLPEETAAYIRRIEP